MKKSGRIIHRFGVALAASPGGAATFVVDSTADAPDANPGDGCPES